MINNEKILSIKNFPSLVNFLAEELQWPIDLDEFDDYESLSYDFNPKELGIREEFISKIKNIKHILGGQNLQFLNQLMMTLAMMWATKCLLNLQCYMATHLAMSVYLHVLEERSLLCMCLGES